MKYEPCVDLCFNVQKDTESRVLNGFTYFNTEVFRQVRLPESQRNPRVPGVSPWGSTPCNVPELKSLDSGGQGLRGPVRDTPVHRAGGVRRDRRRIRLRVSS